MVTISGIDFATIAVTLGPSGWNHKGQQVERSSLRHRPRRIRRNSSKETCKWTMSQRGGRPCPSRLLMNRHLVVSVRNVPLNAEIRGCQVERICRQRAIRRFSFYKFRQPQPMVRSGGVFQQPASPAVSDSPLVASNFNDLG